jgi:adenylate kinase
MSRKKIVILFGPPGSGKTTQAALVARKLGLIQLDTGRILEAAIYDPANQADPYVAEQKKLFEAGKLLDSGWAFSVIKNSLEGISAVGMGAVLSGSPRVLDEAQKLLPVIENLFGKENIFAFVIRVPEEVSLKRNESRLICSKCYAPVLTEFVGDLTACPICGGELRKRTVDNPETILVRLEEYHKRTEPILEFMKSEGYKLQEVDGTAAPYKVFESIYDHLKNT